MRAMLSTPWGWARRATIAVARRTGSARQGGGDAGQPAEEARRANRKAGVRRDGERQLVRARSRRVDIQGLELPNVGPHDEVLVAGHQVDVLLARGLRLDRSVRAD